MHLFSFIATTIFLYFVKSSESQFTQKLILYDQSGCRGQSSSISRTDIPNLTSLGFNDRTVSAKINGIWVFYESPNYSSGSTQYFYSPTNDCVNLGDYLSRRVSSLRHAGSSDDYRIDSLTLYEGTFFTEEETQTSKDIPTMRFSRNGISSLIASGASPWTIYDRPFYQGNYKCLRPKRSGEPLFETDIRRTLGSFFIASLRRGCFPSSSSSSNRRAPVGNGLFPLLIINDVGGNETVPVTQPDNESQGSDAESVETSTRKSPSLLMSISIKNTTSVVTGPVTESYSQDQLRSISSPRFDES